MIDRDSAREAAERELSKPEYQEHQPGLPRRVLDWLAEQVDDLFSAAGQLAAGGWLGILAVSLIVVLLLIALRLRLGAIRGAPADGGRGILPTGPMSADHHRAAADQFAADARWNEAVQERMRAVVRALEERSVLQARPDRTAGEAATDAGQALPALAPRLRDAARSFDEVTYGHRTADAAAYRSMKELDTALTSSRPQLTPDNRRDVS